MASWAPTLRFFRFCRAYGGHNNDGDRLLVAVRGEVDLALDLPGVHTHTRLDRLEISVSDEGNPYEVTESAIATARRIEPLLVPLADRVIDPPLDDEHCVCPAYYPELF